MARPAAELPGLLKAGWLAVALSVLTSIDRVAAVEFETLDHGGARYTVCRVAVGKEALAVHATDESGQPFARLDRLATWADSRGRHLTFAMNAGMFRHDLSPVGLLVVDGREIAPLNTAEAPGNFFLKPNGVFLVSDRGARVVATLDYAAIKERIMLATQSGPLLVHGGRLHPALKPESNSRHIRNGVGVPSADTAVFVISDNPVSLHELALAFRDGLQCADALYLDGAISSIWAPQLHRHDTHATLGPILAVTE